MTWQLDAQPAMSVPEVAPSRSFAIGDVHGEVSLLRRLIAMLNLHQSDTVVFIGDYVDRGEDSIATIDVLVELATSVHCIFLG